MLESMLVQIMNLILWILLEPEGRLTLLIGWVAAIIVLLIVICCTERGGRDNA